MLVPLYCNAGRLLWESLHPPVREEGTSGQLKIQLLIRAPQEGPEDFGMAHSLAMLMFQQGLEIGGTDQLVLHVAQDDHLTTPIISNAH